MDGDFLQQRGPFLTLGGYVVTQNCLFKVRTSTQFQLWGPREFYVEKPPNPNKLSIFYPLDSRFWHMRVWEIERTPCTLRNCRSQIIHPQSTYYISRLSLNINKICCKIYYFMHMYFDFASRAVLYWWLGSELNNFRWCMTIIPDTRIRFR